MKPSLRQRAAALVLRIFGVRDLGYPSTNVWRSLSSWGNDRQVAWEQIEYPDAYRLVGHIRFAVSTIAESIAKLELRFYTRARNGKLTEIERDPGNPRNVKELFETVNDEDSGFDLKEQLAGSILLHGLSYLELDFKGTSIPRELYVRSPLAVKLLNDGSRQLGSGRDARVVRSIDMPSFRLWDPKFGQLGSSPLESLALSYGAKRDLDRWLRTFFARGGRVAGSYVSELTVSPENRAILEDYFKQNSTPDRYPFPIVTAGGLKPEREGLTVDEMKLTDLDLVMLHNVLRVYKIPAAYANIMDGAGMNSDVFETAKIQLFEQAVEPLCTRAAATINEKVLGLGYWGPNVVCKFDYSTVDAYQARRLKQGEAYTKLAGAPIMTRPEAREEMSLDPLASIPDELLVPTTMSTESQASAQADAKVQAALAPPPVPPTAAGADNGGRAHESARVNEDASTPHEKRRDRLRVRAGRNLRPHERKMERGVRRMFNRQERNAVASLRAQYHRAIDVESLVENGDDDREIAERLIRAVVQDAGEAAISDLGMELAFAMNRREVRSWIASKAANLVTNINETTRTRLRAAIDEAVSNDATLDDLIEAVRTVFSGRRANAPTIARTETVGAYNFGSVEGWDQSGVVEGKEWLTAHDDRVRESHADADGEQVGLDDDFQVGGSRMAFPGDPRGDVSEVANCRCTVLPVLRVAGNGDFEEGVPRAIARRLGGVFRRARDLEPAHAIARPDASPPEPVRNGNGHGELTLKAFLELE